MTGEFLYLDLSSAFSLGAGLSSMVEDVGAERISRTENPMKGGNFS